MQNRCVCGGNKLESCRKYHLKTGKSLESDILVE